MLRFFMLSASDDDAGTAFLAGVLRCAVHPLASHPFFYHDLAGIYRAGPLIHTATSAAVAWTGATIFVDALLPATPHHLGDFPPHASASETRALLRYGWNEWKLVTALREVPRPRQDEIHLTQTHKANARHSSFPPGFAVTHFM
ncbi:hypothetical protein B0H19DRAFT_1369140 [Mycena capillaripes]|nr:hypothetical protein B0H19DRAFT_1386812 [Mycena capillaripes]KAJ6586170.1 hypothetical protein B0H19DRAFT_1369140 [Mycena capillaripes]